jgi:L-serine/L-threonine ammonia-lyase
MQTTQHTKDPLTTPLHLETPLLRSSELSEKSGLNIFLKLEDAQATGSYKVRGIGKLCQHAVKNGCKQFLSPSGGNAGITAAYCAKQLGVPCTVIVPETTAPFMIEKIRHDATQLVVMGRSVDEASARAKEIAAEQPGSVVIHPFDHPIIWEGHSTIVDEIEKQMPEGVKPDVFLLSVGGGGLMCGILQGIHKRPGWEHIHIVAMETEGTRSFNACVESGEWVELKEIKSIAKTLGVKKVCRRAYDWISEHKELHSRLVTDKQAVSACIKFTDDHRFLVSPSCGTALAAIYDNILNDLQGKGQLPQGNLNVVVIVCGGNEVTLKELDHWKEEFGIEG